MKFIIKMMLAITPLLGVDLIFFGGNIITMDDKTTLAEAVAIHNGKISSIGKKDHIMKMKSWKSLKNS